MRIFGLLVLLWGLVSVCVAGDQARQASPRQAAATSFNSDLFDNTSGIVRPDFSGLAASDGTDRDRGFDAARTGELTCYTIESYLVKRKSRDSDAVEPAGHSTCQRASKYSVKQAERAGSR